MRAEPMPALPPKTDIEAASYVRFVPIADIMRSGRLGCRAIGSTSHFEGYKPRQQRGRIKLTNYAFDIAQAPRERMHWNDITVASRCQRDKAEIENRTGE
jgi:hypothetical protein